MLVFSKNLNRSLSRAIALAEEQPYDCATPEHVLLALIDDPDAIPVMLACNVDLEKFRDAVEASMPHSDYEPGSDEDETSDSEEDDTLESDHEPIPVEHFQIVLQRAIAHARSSGCEEVNSADVLVAMLDGSVGDLLNEHGMTRYDVTTYICHGIAKDAQASSGGGDVPNRPGLEGLNGDATGSSMLRVCLLNDDYTSMDFVVRVLEEVFELKNEDAERMMLQLHHDGLVACGTFTREEAQARAARVMDLARQHQHPLRCRVQE